ncbi:MAG: DUF1963 domain-containing protein [Pseudomonadota bacterium]
MAEPTYDPSLFPAELKPELAKFEATRRAFVAIEPSPGNTSPVGSHFRGQPYWPAGLDYPVDQDGNEMILLAQIHFSEVPNLPDYPESGLLQFFISPSEADDHMWGMIFDEQDFTAGLLRQEYFRVIFHPDITADADLRTSFPGPETFLPIDGEMSLRFEVAEEVVKPVDREFKALMGEEPWPYFERLGEEATEHFNGYFSATEPRPPAKIGGYGDFAQDDPRPKDPEEDWVILLWIDSFYLDENHQALWGDAGTAVFAIERDRLIDRDFSRVLYSWDSH